MRGMKDVMDWIIDRGVAKSPPISAHGEGWSFAHVTMTTTPSTWPLTSSSTSGNSDKRRRSVNIAVEWKPKITTASEPAGMSNLRDGSP